MYPQFDDLSLPSETFKKIEHTFKNRARPLERTLFEYYFQKASADRVITALKSFQNQDGGFGHGIEPDFHLPASSPMATSVGCRILDTLPRTEAQEKMIHRALRYLLVHFDMDRKGWFAVPEAVNDFPHAPWWSWDPQTEQTIIDKSWGNPTAELLGYLWKYRIYSPTWDISPLIDYAISYLANLPEYRSENEIFCFIRLYHVLPPPYREKLAPLITQAVASVVETDPDQWSNYVPSPLRFLLFSEDPLWGISESLVKQYCQFLLDELSTHGVISPTWEWGKYPNHWKLAKTEWMGVLTLNALKSLEKFGML